MEGRYPQIVVIGDSEVNALQYEEAVSIGQAIGNLGATVITGGLGGIMEAVSKGAAMTGALVAGILPSGKIDDANRYCRIVFPTGMGHARNALTVMAGDLVIAIGGGAGTLSEMSFAWIYGKPVIAWEGRGWAGKLAGKSIDDRRDESVVSCKTVEELKALITEYCRHNNLKINE